MQLAEPRFFRRARWIPVVSLSALALLVVAVAAALAAGTDAPPASAQTTQRQIEVGLNHACVLERDGAVTCWGDDSAGQVSAWGTWPYRGEKFASISAGSFLTCGILTNGSVMCWGHPILENGSNRETTNESWATWTARTTQTGYTGWVNTPPPSVKFRPGSLSVGNYHACAIKTNGELACWGKAGSDRLVIPKDSNNQTITDWLMVEAGFANACGIRGASLSAGGSVVCFGRQSHNRSAGPSGAGPFTDVTLALYNGCALAAAGSVECWGGHSGYETYIHPSDPDQRAVNTQINTAPAGVKFTSIEMSTTELYGCGLTEGRTIHCWGWKFAYPSQTIPPRGSFARISVGSFSNCALTAGGALSCWGLDDAGLFTPPSGSFTQTDGGSNFSCALKNDRTVTCWGSDGNRVIQETPATGTFTHISSGNIHACAIKTDGAVACWGGVFLQGSQYLRILAAVAPTGTFKAISAGPDLTCGIRKASDATDGTLHCWGATTHNRQTEPTGTFTHVAVGATHICAIKTDRTVACWGEALFFDREGDGNADDISGFGNHTTTTPPAPPTTTPATLPYKYTAISAGEAHTCAIRDDKKAVCWGYHADSRQYVPGATASRRGFGVHNYVAIATGGQPNCAIREGTGKLSCWNNEKSQYLPGASLLAKTGFKSLGAGSYHMCAINSANGLDCWGAGNVIPFPAQFAVVASADWTSDLPSAVAVGQQRSISLTGAFQSSLPFSYRARSSNEAVVRAEIQGGALQLQAVGPGTATIVLEALVNSVVSAQASFTVTVPSPTPSVTPTPIATPVVTPIAGWDPNVPPLGVGQVRFVRLENAFEAENTDLPLTYTANSSNNFVVRIAPLRGSTLRLQAVGSGTAQIEIVASINENYSAARSFKVRVVDVETPTPIPTSTPTPAPSPTATRVPTVTPTPTNTPAPPVPTRTPTPEPTPTSTPIPPTVTPTNTPVPVAATATPPPTDDGGAGPLGIIIGLAILAALGAGGIFLLRRRGMGS